MDVFARLTIGMLVVSVVDTLAGDQDAAQWLEMDAPAYLEELGHPELSKLDPAELTADANPVALAEIMGIKGNCTTCLSCECVGGRCRCLRDVWRRWQGRAAEYAEATVRGGHVDRCIYFQDGDPDDVEELPMPDKRLTK